MKPLNFSENGQEKLLPITKGGVIPIIILTDSKTFTHIRGQYFENSRKICVTKYRKGPS
jgi:hypothetical protein